MMERGPNIFHKLVTDENSTTELICNLMRFAAFRQPLLARLLSDACAAQIEYDDIETQKGLEDHGRPDLFIENDRVCAIVEVKVCQFLGPTAHQQDHYFSYLSKHKAPERWLVFLVPKAWVHRESLEQSFESLRPGCGGNGVQTKIVCWEDVIDIIEKNDLHLVSPFFSEFHQFLEARYRPSPIVFCPSEVRMLFSKNFPTALSKLELLINEIEEMSGEYDPKGHKEGKLCLVEYGLYFFGNWGDTHVLWFGMWTDFWKETGIPLCFGVKEDCPPNISEAFRASYKGKIQSFDTYTLGVISQETLEGKNAAKHVWAQLGPVLKAVAEAQKPRVLSR